MKKTAILILTALLLTACYGITGEVDVYLEADVPTCRTWCESRYRCSPVYEVQGRPNPRVEQWIQECVEAGEGCYEYVDTYRCGEPRMYPSRCAVTRLRFPNPPLCSPNVCPDQWEWYQDQMEEAANFSLSYYDRMSERSIRAHLCVE